MTLEEFCTKKLFARGSNSKCYLVGQDRVLKIFNTPKTIDNVEKFKYFLEYENDSFIFPYEFIVYNNRFLGYVTQKSEGKELEEIFDNIDFNVYSYLSKTLEKDIEYISEGKIIITDLSTRNILCEKESLKVIDPDFYKIYKSKSSDYVLDCNMYTYKYCITNLFIFPYLNLNKQPDKYVVDKINSYLKSNICVSEIIISLKNDLEIYYNSEFRNLKEFKKVLRR